MKKKRIRLVAAVLVSALLTGLTGCSSTEAEGPDFAQGNKWIDSDIIGSVSEGDEIRLQDDFAAAANKEWILTDGAGLKKRNFEYISDQVNDKKVALLSDDSVTGKEAEELKKFASLASDWDYRNSCGIEPLRPYIESIEAISDMDGFYAWITDPEKNPLGLAPVVLDSAAFRLRAYPDELTVQYSSPDLSLGSDGSYYDIIGNALESKEITDQKVSCILSGLGYDESAIDRILKENYSLEKKLAKISSPVPTSEDAEVKNTASTEELIAAAGDYPLEEYMKSRGYNNVRHMMGDKKYLKKISGVCKQANLEGLKAMLTVGYILRLGHYLDRQTYDTFNEISKPRGDKEMPDYSTDAEKDRNLLCNDIASSGLVAAMDKLYIEKYIDPETAGVLTDLTKDVIDIYRTEIFPNEEWLSEEGKAKCIDKLDAITLNIIYPDFSYVEYDSLDIVPKEEGGTYLEAYLDSMRYLTLKKGDRAGQKYVRSEWFPYDADISTTVTNSVYVPTANSINIYAGMLEDPA